MKKVETNERLNQMPILHKLLHETYRHRMHPRAKTTFSTVLRKGNKIIRKRLKKCKFFICKHKTGFQRFDPDHSAGVIKLSDDNLKATLTSSSGWQNIRCVCPFSDTYNYCEFKIESGPNIMVGGEFILQLFFLTNLCCVVVVQGDCSRTGYAGQYSNGYVDVLRIT